jgi:hypothetical protein
MKDTLVGATSDHAYGLLYEMRLMSADTSTVPDRMEIFDPVSSYMGEIEFENDELHYPIGIMDYKYNSIDVSSNLVNGSIYLQDSAYHKSSQPLVVTERKTALISPLFDYFDSEQMALVFKKEFFLSNYRTVDEIKSISLTFNNITRRLSFGETYYFEPAASESQLFYVEIMYSDSTVLRSHFTLHTPEINLKSKDEAKGNSFAECTKDGVITIDGNKLKWCMIPRCGYNGRIFKPYILLTGYRPPMFGQSFRKTWKIYNDNHQSLLNSLRDNNYDIFLVKFNLSAKPYEHGMVESAALLEQFIRYLNTEKGSGSGQENIIQGSSMSSDIARLTLLTMEKKHFEIPDYPHHHTRLNIAYDGNFYGANLPLGYQCQIFSAFKYPSFFSPFSAIQKLTLGVFLFATMNQKAVRELLMYHAQAVDEYIFSSPNEIYSSVTPTHHWRRQGFYNQLAAVNSPNSPYFFPMPLHTRNIAISLGKISGKNSDGDGRFNNAGEYWRNVNLGLWQFKIGTAKYMPAGQTFQIFKRKKFGIPMVKHELNVTQMQEIDNASGSYLDKFGNIISVANWTYFPLLNIFDGKDYFSHKSVITALGINKNLWPANGSLTLNMKDLKLMFNQLGQNYNNLNLQSDHYGYPNLGRPNDHFQVTPFEAIYVDNQINPHIDLEKDDADDLYALNNFILNEVEPWYLGLQNTHVGSQARPDYIYRSYRRAKHRIVVGHLVTPTTDPGDYVVEANGELTLKAGDEIDLQPGVHFKAGSTVHIVPEYEVCSNSAKSGSSGNAGNEKETNAAVPNLASRTEEEPEVERGFAVYPNPASGIVKIEAKQGESMDAVLVFSLRGEKCLESNPNTSSTELNIEELKQGVYLVQIHSGDKIFMYKLIID